MEEIIPLHSWDSMPWQQSMVISVTLRFDSVLDPVKLENGLERLVQLKNWRKLGARFRRKADKKLEYVIPASFTAERPGIGFSHQTFECKVTEHPLASKLPRSVGPTETLDDFSTFDSIVTSDRMPTRLENWIHWESPQLFVHVTSFQDATLITLRWCHTSWDAAGTADFLRAWTAVLESREEDVQEVTGFDQDPLSPLPVSKEVSKGFLLYDQLLHGLGMALFIFFFIVEQIFHPKHEARIVRVDNDTFESLYAQAKKEIESLNDPGTFVSESDVLLAWWAKVLLLAHKVPATRPVNVQNAMAFRHQLPDCFPANTAYLGNAVSAAMTQFTTAEKILNSSTAEIALRFRESIQQQATREQVIASISCNTTDGTGLLKPWNAFLIILSNWNKGRFYDVDFSAAVVEIGTPLEERMKQKGRPSFIGSYAIYHGQPAMRNAGAVVGKDPNGNWWISWTLRKGIWEQVDAVLREMVLNASHR